MLRTIKGNINLFYRELIIATIFLYFLLNYGFMQVKAPLGIPVGQVVLFIILFLMNHKVALPAFAKCKFFIPYVIWLALGFGHALICITEYGIYAIRDASLFIDSLYIYVGYTFASNKHSLDTLCKRLPLIFLVVFLYSLTFPFRESLRDFSPILKGFQGQEVTLFFSYTNTAFVLLLASLFFYECTFSKEISVFSKLKKKSFLFAVLNTAYVLILFPSRTLYIQLFCMYLYLTTRINLSKLRKLLFDFIS